MFDERAWIAKKTNKKNGRQEDVKHMLDKSHPDAVKKLTVIRSYNC